MNLSADKILDTKIGQASGTFVEWDVSNYVIAELEGDSNVSFNISSTNTGSGKDVAFHSKQATDVDDNRPILILHYEKEVPTVEFDVVSLTGLESQNSANLQVNLSEVNTADVLVNYTVSGTAFGNEADYTLANGTLTISAGNTSANIVIADINDDTNEEANETIIVTLSNPIRAMLGNNITHTYTIIDNDVDPVTYISVEDTFIRNGVHSDENYGSLDYMAIKKDNNPDFEREMFLKFDLSSVTGNVTSAKLKMQIRGANTAVTSTSWDVKAVDDDSWTESTLKWNNKPTPNVTSLSNKTGQEEGTVEWDVTNFTLAQLTSDDIVSLNISSTSNAGSTDATFFSRERTSTLHRPVLVLNF